MGLRIRDVDVVTSQEDDCTELPDAELLEHVTSLGRVLFTQDQDFLRLAREYQNRQQTFGGIIFGHQTDVTISRCLQDLELIAKVYEPKIWLTE